VLSYSWLTALNAAAAVLAAVGAAFGKASRVGVLVVLGGRCRGADEWAEVAVVVEGEAEILVDVHQALLLAAGLEQFAGPAGRGEEAMGGFHQQAVALGRRQQEEGLSGAFRLGRHVRRRGGVEFQHGGETRQEDIGRDIKAAAFAQEGRRGADRVAEIAVGAPG